MGYWLQFKEKEFLVFAYQKMAKNRHKMPAPPLIPLVFLKNSRQLVRYGKEIHIFSKAHKIAVQKWYVAYF